MVNEQIRIANWEGNDNVTTHQLPLFIGKFCVNINENPNDYKIDIKCNEKVTGIVEQLGAEFKALVPIKDSKNIIKFELISKISQTVVAVKTITLFFEKPNDIYRLKFYYVTAVDQPQRIYDGYEDEVESKLEFIAQLKERSQEKTKIYEDFQNFLTKSPIEIAKSKVSIAGLLIQTAYAEMLQDHKLQYLSTKLNGRKITFSAKISENFPENGVHVEHVILPKTQEEFEKYTDSELYDYIQSQICGKENTIDVVVMGMTRWDKEKKKALSHTALGGYPLALFGSGTLHTWASSISEIFHSFQNNKIIDNTRLFEDSCRRGYFWANFSTALGAVAHEIGHSFRLRHTASVLQNKTSFTCMSRGFDHFNRIFTLSEGNLLFLNNDIDACCLHLYSVVRLLFNPFFQNLFDPVNTQTLSPPDIQCANDQLIVSSDCGLVEISLFRVEDQNILYTQSLSVLSPKLFSIPLAEIQKIADFGNDKVVGCSCMDIHGLASEKVLHLVSEQEKLHQRKVLFGSTVRFVHLLSGQTLQSYPVNYLHENSSRFQQVTCAEDFDNILNDWIIQPSFAERNQHFQQPVTSTTRFLLFHVVTRQFLHSHYGHPSPLTHQQELCCFANEFDDNNHWIVESPAGELRTGVPVKIRHSLTGCYLHSHSGHVSDVYTFSQQEATCWPHENDDNNLFVVHLIN